MCLLYNINLSFFAFPVNNFFNNYKYFVMFYIFYILRFSSSFAGRT